MQFFPLALDQVGAYVAARNLTLQRYRGGYEKHFQKVFREKPTNWTYRDATIFTTWTISLDYIKETNFEASELFFLLSMLSNVDIWEKMLRAGIRLAEDGMC